MSAEIETLLDAYRIQIERRCLYHREAQITVGEVRDRNETRRDLAKASEKAARDAIMAAMVPA